jgi:hypothetical protein
LSGSGPKATPDLGNSLPSYYVAGDGAPAGSRSSRDRTGRAPPGDGEPPMMAESNSYGSLSQRQIFRWSYGAVRPGACPSRSQACRATPAGLVDGRRGTAPACQRERRPSLPGGRARYSRPVFCRGPPRQKTGAPGCPRRILIAGHSFKSAGSRDGFRDNKRPFQPPGNRRPAILGARYAGLLPGQPGRAGTRSAAAWRGRAGPGVRLGPPALVGVKRPWRLFSCPAPAAGRGRHRERASVLARAVLSMYFLGHAYQHRPGSTGPPSCRAGITAGRQPFGVDARLLCWRSCYLILLAPKVCVPTVVQL